MSEAAPTEIVSNQRTLANADTCRTFEILFKGDPRRTKKSRKFAADSITIPSNSDSKKNA
jgi:hypothetical protein